MMLLYGACVWEMEPQTSYLQSMRSATVIQPLHLYASIFNIKVKHFLFNRLFKKVVYLVHIENSHPALLAL